MASTNRSQIGFVHYAAMFFALLSIILGTVAFLFHRDLAEAQQTAEKAKADADNKGAVNQRYLTQIEELKKAVGHQFDRVGVSDVGADGSNLPDEPDNPTTVLGSIKTDLAFAGPYAGANMSETIGRLREELDNTTRVRSDAEAQITTQKQRYDGLRPQYEAQVTASRAARENAEKRTTAAVTEKNEQVAVMTREIEQRRRQVSDLNESLDIVREELDSTRKKFTREVSLLTRINDELREKLDAVVKVSFERPDGVIRKVDHTTGLVWISLGTKDQLPIRTSFSVYTKTHHGVGRGEDDLKGAIEVTRILGPHLAEARILDEDFSSPIASNDPIYTPLWSPGRQHRFAVVGKIDIDGNNISDREQFREIVRTNGGVLDVEVLDDGRMIGDGLTVHHKFLIMGEFEDPTLEIDPEKQEALERMMEARNELVTQARLNGVRIVSIDLFLEWAGYRPQQRLWRPGEEVPWKLTAGAHSPAISDQPQKGRQAAGQVSKVFGNRGRVRQQKSSSGQTSKIYGN